MDQGGAAVILDDKIRRLAEDVPAAAITPEIIRHQAESLEELEIQVQEAPAPGRRIGRVVCRVPDLEVPFYSSNLKVKLLGGFQNQLRNHVWSDVGNTQGVCAD